MVLPVVLLSLRPSRVSQPCANTRVGTGRPAACSMAGQYRQWKRMISLPTKCIRSSACSQYFTYFGARLAEPSAVM